MSSTKRVNGDYNIHAKQVVIHGNLSVMGNTSAIDSTVTQIKDNMIYLNDGEQGDGVTLGYSGLEVDRGPNFSSVMWRWNEGSLSWEGYSYNENVAGDDLVPVSAADPVYPNNVVTLNYLTTVAAAGPGGNTTEVQFKDDTGGFGGNAAFVFDKATGTASHGNLSLTSSTYPSPITDHTVLYSGTPGGGGTGLYFVNNSNRDEVISKTKAFVLSLIFG
jgi:hypothetical protein